MSDIFFFLMVYIVNNATSKIHLIDSLIFACWIISGCIDGLQICLCWNHIGVFYQYSIFSYIQPLTKYCGFDYLLEVLKIRYLVQYCYHHFYAILHVEHMKKGHVMISRKIWLKYLIHIIQFEWDFPLINGLYSE